ncbi:MAG: citramalate synthase [Candidatus Margulisiibacteriota bacterium]
MSKKIYLFDTTLRDGEQGENISFTVADKIKIAKLLDDFGIDYIEGGWPGSNPKAVEFFNDMKSIKLKRAKLAAFGSTRRANVTAAEDKNLQAIVETGVPVAVIFGKSWDFHALKALKVTLKENLEMIADSVSFLKKEGLEVFFDAEHFFDGYKNNPEYALKTLLAAEKAGADFVILCDTNGGTMPFEILDIVKTVKNNVKIPLGIHAHNDSDCSVANSVVAVEAGCTQVQGTINGYGERCGNANLCSIIPCLQLKLGKKCVTDEQLKGLKALSHHISEIANLAPYDHQPFTGNSAFAHKGGIHVSAVMKHSETYEHIKPELVGNKQRVIVSELSGVSNLVYKAEEYGVNLKKGTPEVKELLAKIKQLEHSGYQFEEGEGSFELLMKRATGEYNRLFSLEGFRVINEKRGEEKVTVEATIKVDVNGQLIHTAADGNGPVSALDHALRKALEGKFPVLKEIRLTDYKVRVLNSKKGTDALVRVIIESTDGSDTWGTVGVSSNIIEASWDALIDSLEYKLLKEHR